MTNNTNPTPSSLPFTTVIPNKWELFVPYLNRVYEAIASTVNFKDDNFYPMPITDTPTNILNLANYGAFIICVSGIDSSLPTITASLCKASKTAAGVINVIGSQVGTGAWAGFSLTITSTATNFQIAHNRTGVSGNFNIRIIGTQQGTGIR